MCRGTMDRGPWDVGTEAYGRGMTDMQDVSVRGLATHHWPLATRYSLVGRWQRVVVPGPLSRLRFLRFQKAGMDVHPRPSQ